LSSADGGFGIYTIALPTLTSFVVAILVWFLCVLNFYADLRMIADARKLERIRAPNDPSERST